VAAKNTCDRDPPVASSARSGPGFDFLEGVGHELAEQADRAHPEHHCPGHRAMRPTGVTDRLGCSRPATPCWTCAQGRAAGAGVVVGVLTGAQTADELAGEHPTHVLAGVAALPDLLR
jgi:phosphoglycolate phosphatase